MDYLNKNNIKQLINSEEMLLELGRQEFEQKKYEQALENFKGVLFINPDNFEARKKTKEIERIFSYLEERKAAETSEITIPDPLKQIKSDVKNSLKIEKIARKKYTLNQIHSFLQNGLTMLPSELADIQLAQELKAAALERTLHVYALFSGFENQKQKGYAHPITVTLSPRSKGNEGKIRLVGGRIEKKEEKIQLPDGRSVTTTTKSSLEGAMEKAIASAFYCLQNLQQNCGIPADEQLKIAAYDIECIISDPKTSIIDGGSLGLAVAMSAVANYLDLPTKQSIALTGTIDGAKLGKIGPVESIIPKIKAAIEEEVVCVIIPASNYNELKETSPQLEALSEEIKIVPATYLSEVVKTAFDMEKIKESLKKKLLPR